MSDSEEGEEEEVKSPPKKAEVASRGSPRKNTKAETAKSPNKVSPRKNNRKPVEEVSISPTFSIYLS